MTKAKTIDRLKLTRDRSPLLKSKYADFDESLKMAFYENVAHADDIPAAPGVEDNPDPTMLDEHHCPFCGGETTRFEGCYRCKKCGWSKC